MSRPRRKKAEVEELFLFAPEDYAEQPATVKQPEETVIADIDEAALTAKMSDAEQFLDTLDDSKIRLVAMETATIYQSGVTHNCIYQLQSLPERSMDWYEFVALFYCAFGRAFPSMMDKIDQRYIACYHARQLPE